MPGPVFIAGDRIELRTIEEEDLGFLQEGMNPPAVRQYAGGDLPYNRHRYRDERFDPLSGGDYLQLLVCDGDQRLGDVSLAPIDERRGWANLGFWIHPDHQGRGYATAAARLAVDHGFDELGLHRISATIAAPNEASQRVVEKLGFVHEGTKREDAFTDGRTSTARCTPCCVTNGRAKASFSTTSGRFPQPRRRKPPTRSSRAARCAAHPSRGSGSRPRGWRSAASERAPPQEVTVAESVIHRDPHN